MPVIWSSSVTGAGGGANTIATRSSSARRSITMIARMPEESMNDTSSRSIRSSRPSSADTACSNLASSCIEVALSSSPASLIVVPNWLSSVSIRKLG